MSIFEEIQRLSYISIFIVPERSDDYGVYFTCRIKTDEDLAKECSCNMVVDRDGEMKCKNCKEIWNWNLNLSFYACEKCGYDN